MSLSKYPELKTSGLPFSAEIPRHWSEKRLKHVGSVQPSNVDKKSVDGQPTVRLCNYTDVYYNDAISPFMTFMQATATDAQIAKFTLRAGDTIITKDSETPDDIARSTHVPCDMPGVICGYHLAVVRPTNDVRGEFIKRYFDADTTRSYFHTRTNGLTRVGLSQYAIDNAPIAVPPLEEQDSILSFLDDETLKIDRLIALQKRMVALLREKQRSTTWREITKGIKQGISTTASNETWIGDIPKHWRVIPIRKVARLESGHTPSKSKPEYWVESECTIQWFTLTDIGKVRDGTRIYVEDTENKISALGLANSSARLLPAKTVFLSRTASVGFSGIMSVEMAVSQDFAAWVCGERLVPEYLLLCLRVMKPEFKRLMMGSTHKTIYMPDIEKLAIPLPPMEEQREIVAHIFDLKEKAERLINRAETNIKLLQERRSVLISAAVTGRIDVRGYKQNKEREAA